MSHATRILLASLLVAGCGGTPGTSTPAQTPRPTASNCSVAPATLRFAWPDTLTARVEGRDLTESAFADGSSPMRGDSPSDLRMHAVREGDRHRVRFEVAGRSRLRTTGFAPEVAGVRPHVLLSREGAVLAVEGLDEMQPALARAVQRGELTPDQVDGMGPNLSPEVQVATARAHWEWILRAWHGRTLRCDEIARVRTSLPSLTLGMTGAVRLDAELELVSDADCGGETVTPGARCVLLRARQRALTDDLVRGVAAFAARTGRGATIPMATLDRTVELIAEVDTLVPHRIAIDERSSLTWHVDGEPDRTRHIHDRQEYALDYSAAATRRDTVIIMDPSSGGFAVQRDGRPVQLPDTPTCRAFDACCGALGTMGALLCGTMVAQLEGDDCTDMLAQITAVGRGREGGTPPECAGP